MQRPERDDGRDADAAAATTTATTAAAAAATATAATLSAFVTAAEAGRRLTFASDVHVEGATVDFPPPGLPAMPRMRRPPWFAFPTSPRPATSSARSTRSIGPRRMRFR